MSNFWYCVRQGFKNFAGRPLFTIASVATVASAIFIFCAFLAAAANLSSLVREAENSVGITVFFEPETGDMEKDRIRQQIIDHGGVSAIRYISSDEAWSNFKKDYFGDAVDELAAAFEDDNPLAQSDSLEVFPESVESQSEMAAYIGTLPGVREVNFLSGFVDATKKVNRGIYILSLVISAVLFAVAIFLISNTIHVAAEFRRRENEIMRMIGATDFMIRFPFVVEGTLIGALGTLIPLIAIRLIYRKAEQGLAGQTGMTTGILKDIVKLVPLDAIFPQMALAALVMGLGTGIVVSAVTINRHLRV